MPAFATLSHYGQRWLPGALPAAPQTLVRISSNAVILSILSEIVLSKLETRANRGIRRA
ncbi:hypothetical protein [Marinobacterium rhizophilum]|uniref:hypothetical protein n=1 Tax=Marinobacterium rhizophilum TaxID=420402 RepID=UPI00035EC98E|nr:hypothetical protein [Marinobacterium rhizophilum]